MPDVNEEVYKNACSECKRRKQKCNRDWPCVNCMRRHVPMLCEYMTDPSSSLDVNVNGYIDGESVESQDTKKLWGCGIGPSYLRRLGHRIELGTSWHPLFLNSARPGSTFVSLISREDSDMLLQTFTDKVHPHCDIIHTTPFTKQYSDWWAARFADLPVNMDWTCLLLEIFATAAQQLPSPCEEGHPGQRFHDVATALCKSRSNPSPSLSTLQRMIYAAFWHRNEGQLSECRMKLSCAWQMAIQLGIHQESDFQDAMNLQVEIGRRAICYMATWDLETAILLSQPKIVDFACCFARLPNAQDNPALGQVMASLELLKFVFDCRDHSQTKLEEGVQAWQESLASCFKYPDEALEREYPETKFYRMYARILKLTALISPFIPRPEQPLVEQQNVTVINYCLSLLQHLMQFIAYLRGRECRALFLSYYVFASAAVLSCSLFTTMDQSLNHAVHEKLRWAYDFLLRSEASSTLAMALTLVVPEGIKSSQPQNAPVLVTEPAGLSSQSFFDDLQPEHLDDLVDRWSRGEFGSVMRTWK